MSLVSYKFTPPLRDKRASLQQPRPRSISRRVRRLIYALFRNYPETIFIVLGFGTIAVALIPMNLAIWLLRITD